jgi:hypothetical protein
MTVPYQAYRIAQQINMPRRQIVALVFQHSDRKKVSAAGMPGATIIGHDGSIVNIDMRRNALRLLTPYN